MELNLKVSGGDIFVSKLSYPNHLYIEIWEQQEDKSSTVGITKEQAQQIIDHLKKEFEI